MYNYCLSSSAYLHYRIRYRNAPKSFWLTLRFFFLHNLLFEFDFICFVLSHSFIRLYLLEQQDESLAIVTSYTGH